ncbi:MAG TPA: type II toxin-antitoxin system RelE/ParE family toxin, partial [Candidatus Acidoferrales bacterium]|nr:type II toxin-antitoxin system RelE/ParE family toxin [Candidatus Acidoferrales bacterium]
MAWEVEGTREFEEWYASLDGDDQDAVNQSIERLEESGPSLSRPHADTVRESKHANMKELRTQSKGRPLRTFFAFDPRRTAILLLAG